MAWNDARQRRRGGYDAYAGSSMAPELIEAQGIAPLLKIPGQMVEHERMSRELALAEEKFREDKLQSDRESLEELRRLGLFGDGGAAQGMAGAPQEGGRPTVVSTPGDPRYVSDQGTGISMRRPESYTAEEFAQDPNAIAREMELQKSYADLYALEQAKLADAARLEEGPWGTADTAQALIQQLGFSPERAARAAAQVSAGGETPALKAAKRRAKARGVEVGPTAYRRGLGVEAEKAAAQRGVVAEELRRLGIEIPEGEADAIAEQLGRWGMLPKSPYEALPEGSRPSTYAQALAIEQTRPMATLLEGGWMGKEAMGRLQRMRALEQTLRARGDEAAAAELEEVRKVATEVEAREYEVFRKGMYGTVKDSVGKRWDDQKINDFIATYWDNEGAAKAQHAKLAEIIKQRIAVSAAHRKITEDQKAKREMAKNRAKQYDSRANQGFNERLDHASTEVARQKEAIKDGPEYHALMVHGTALPGPVAVKWGRLEAAEESIKEYRQWASKTREEQGEDFWKGLPALRAGLDERLQGTTIMFEGRRVDLLSYTRPDEWAEAREVSVSRADHDANLKSLGGRVDPLEDLPSKVPTRGSDKVTTRDVKLGARLGVENGVFSDLEEGEAFIRGMPAPDQRAFIQKQADARARAKKSQDDIRARGANKDSKRKGGGAIPSDSGGSVSVNFGKGTGFDQEEGNYTSVAQREAYRIGWRKGPGALWQKFDKSGNSLPGRTATSSKIEATYGE